VHMQEEGLYTDRGCTCRQRMHTQTEEIVPITYKDRNS
jgi:hypothetical protein